ncbi:GH39 family glycosyl hydrolase [Metabacillus endolithicus]|uniref:Helix-turn-helix domain-containing protein n=1 Tax=Metabacillus endolithicus TaxID=1535204 RepID=A0ABW5C407_9BACI|nr:helix-turn-helix domain-containing protein [Metabacillus endolithicus]UPG62613.1 helix-turn-helix domain-containing protein [Metabacillus endolithicus]
MFSSQTVQTSVDSKLITISVMHGKSVLDHAHKDIELIYIIKGNLRVKVNSKTITLSKFDFLLLNSNELHSFQSDEDNLYVVIHFNYYQLCSLFLQENVLFECNSIENETSSDQEFRRVIEELLSVYLKQSDSSLVEFWEKAFKLISVIHFNYLKSRKHQELKHFSPESGNNERLSEILEYVENNFREPLSLEEVASIQFITVPYLSKFFKKQTGKTFSQYLNKVRLAHAVNELINTNKTITRIALDNGFPNLAAFNRVFNEKYQVKPVEYRKQMVDSIEQEEKISNENSKPEKNEVLKELQNYLDTHLPIIQGNHQLPVEKETHIVKLAKLDAFTKYWNKVINIGYATDLLNSDMQEQIALLQNEIGFTYARFWGLFSDDMHVEDYSNEHISYNFSNINKLLDFLIKNRLKPFIELGPKPKIVNKTLDQTLILQTSSEKSLEEWKNIIRAFLLHCIERYGIEEVETWYFEIWSKDIDPIRDETISGNEINKRHDPSQFEEYFNVFSFLKKITNEIVPLAKVGGCGLTMDLESDKLDLFLNQWRLREVQPDFLSIYLYPIEIDTDKNRIPKKNMLSTNPNYIRNKIKQVRTSLKKSGFDSLELNVTEWNISISNRDYLNDSCFKAAYIVKNTVDNLKHNINMMGYWMCSDIFSDFRDSKNLLHGGAGLITKSGIKKASYHAYVLMKQLGEILVSKGENYIVTKKSGDRYQIICFNYKHFDYSYYLNPEGSTEISEQYDIFENNDPLNLSLEIQGITNGRYRIKEHRINRDQGSVLDEWLKFGSVYDIKPDEVEYLKQKCVPYMKVDHTLVEENSIVLEGKLQPHEVRLYELNLLFSE